MENSPLQMNRQQPACQGSKSTNTQLTHSLHTAQLLPLSSQAGEGSWLCFSAGQTQASREPTWQQSVQKRGDADEVLQTAMGCGRPPAPTDLEDLQMVSRLWLPSSELRQICCAEFTGPFSLPAGSLFRETHSPDGLDLTGYGRVRQKIHGLASTCGFLMRKLQPKGHQILFSGPGHGGAAFLHGQGMRSL